MKIAIYGNPFPSELHEQVRHLLNMVDSRGISICIHDEFAAYLTENGFLDKTYDTYSKSSLHIKDYECLVSIGGDGTLLETVVMIGDSGVPVVGINAGRLGFISSVAIEEFHLILDGLQNGNSVIVARELILAETERNIFPTGNFGLNELTLHKKDTTSMVKIDTYINDEFLNSYWADGIIVSTPTGSTAYSLSCGGPIIIPGSENFVVTPIAPHNLNVRPVVVSNDVTIRLRAAGRSDNFLVALDSRSEIIYPGEEITVRKAPFRFRLLQVPGHTFLDTMRNKLAWGLDKRN